MVGKLIGGLIGLIGFGPVGLVVGVLVGHLFDRGLAANARFVSADHRARIQRSFFETTFLLLGALAKADGRVDEDEIAHTERIFQQMGLSPEQRQHAIGLFRTGAGSGFRLEPVVAQFLEACGHFKPLHQTLMLYLVSLALADETVPPAELDLLRRIARLLDFGAAELEQLLHMTRAQDHFRGRRASATYPEVELEEAYAALGVERNASEGELKRAYRRLMSEHHPDKLIARGVPEEMVRLATEKSQEIQAAYAVIRNSRGGGR